MFNLFSDLELPTIIILGLALCFVLFYEAINGFHDTANAVATVIYTRALKERTAVIMSGIFNFFGVLLGGLSVAYAIVHLLPTDLLMNTNSTYSLAMVFSILLAAIIWNLGTWYFGIPASSSHTLIGSIIGVGLANALITKTSLIDALNIPQMISILLSLVLSPLVGLILAGFIIFALRKFWSGTKKHERMFMTPAEREQIDGKRKPPFWIRIMLLISASGVSFSHGANDGQKGIGLLMLVLIGLAPAGFIVNINASTYEITHTRDSINHIEEYFTFHSQALKHIIGRKTNEAETKSFHQRNEYHCDYTNSFTTLTRAKSLFNSLNSFSELNIEQRGQIRRILICLSDTLNEISKLPEASISNKRYLKQLKDNMLITVEYAPLWIIIAIATSLSIGTMIGWRRVSVTIGKKIGKKDMTYAQGLSAQVTTALSIGIASYTGMPVSTTQILSSSVAGTMLIDGNGIQSHTIKNILLTWFLTLPIAILLSSSLFGLAHLLI